MGVLDSFTPQQIEDALRSTSSFSHQSELKYNVNEDSVLDVQDSLGLDQQYVLVKVRSLNRLGHDQLHPCVIRSSFVIKSNQGDVLMAFNKQQLSGFVVPEKNNIRHIKAVLKQLADYQASALVSDQAFSDYRIENNFDLKHLDQAELATNLKNLQKELDGLLKSQTLVRSIWSASPNSVYVHGTREGCVFTDLAPQQALPPAFDALLYIFSHSDEGFRQKHFEDLTVYYFDCLKEVLKPEITRPHWEEQVRILLPVVKFHLANPGLSGNISNYLKHPIINQEDVFEVLRNYLKSTDYELVDYQLIPLNQKNGHLGEYFHLDIKVNRQNQEDNVQLFAKFLINNTELMSELVHSGLDKKEDFFYKILYPLYAEHGLEELLDFAPRCYLSRATRLIVLDDLSKRGFVGLKPNSVLGYDGLSALTRKLAKLHSCSLITEEILSKQSGNNVRLDQIYGEYFEDPLLTYESSLMKPMYDSSIEVLKYVAGKCPEITSRLHMTSDELGQRLRELFMQLFRQTRTSCKLRNVANHGDLYVANMLFNFEETASKCVKEVVLIDFQLLRYIPPAYELLFFIYSSSTKEVRDKYLSQLLEDYYEGVCGHLRRFNVDPEEVFPKEFFNENVQFARAASLSTAFNYGILIHVDPEFREEIFHDEEKVKYYLEGHKDEVVELFWGTDHYRTVMEGFIKDFVDLIENDVR